MSENERMEFLRKPFLLPPDVLIFSVKELASHIREQLGCSDDDFAVTRPGMRSFSRIVDRETAKLLEEFRQPSPLTEALLRYSTQNGFDPQKILEEAFPMLVSFSEAAFLVPADSPLSKGVSASYASGQLVGGYEIRRLIQVLEDTELYQAQGFNGTAVALKITRLEPSALTIQALSREAAILEHLNGICCPRLMDYGYFRGRPFLVSSWLSGVPISKRAKELRFGATTTWRQQLHELCCHLIAAYSILHDHGVIHGDIHPRNILVDADDSVAIVDFGLSRMIDRSEFNHSERSGLAWFMEPEMAKAILRGQLPPPSSFAGEQYAVAALIYFLVCGEHYLTAWPEREALYRQIVEVTPPPFTRHGFENWPEVETVLMRALTKLPKQRYNSMSEFSITFSQTHPPEPESQCPNFMRVNSPRKWVEEIIKRTTYNPIPYDELFPEPPTAPIYFGAAGLVWFLYRTAQVREDAHLLATADLWLRWILRRKERPDSIEKYYKTNAQEQTCEASIYLGQCGVHQVYAMVCHSRGELESMVRQIKTFTETSKSKEDCADLIYGRSGVLVGGAMLLDILLRSSQFDIKELKTYLLDEANSMWMNLQKFSSIGDKYSWPHLGIAHGWAGMLYAQMMIYNVLHLPPSIGIHDRLQQLAKQSEPVGRGISWIGTVQHPGQISETPAHAPGWCSGSAGFVHLWLMAHKIFREEKYLDMAEKAAWHSWEHPDRFPNLCCGLTGRAFALLKYYRYTGERIWLIRVQQLAERAFGVFNEKLVWDSRTLSLYRGALGPALLAIELERPEQAVMPIFDLEGWPSNYIHPDH